jgi:hypothetical protein
MKKVNESKSLELNKEEVLARIQEIEQSKQKIGSPEELEALEQKIRGLTNQLAALVLQQKVQESLDSEEQKEKEAAFIKNCPKRMKSDGFETVKITTAGGNSIRVRARYYLRSCDRRRGKKRHKGVYAGLILLGIHDRCTPGLTAMVSVWAALLSSFEEVRQVLLEQGVMLGVKVIRKLAYRYADRARIMQQIGQMPSGEEDNLEGRKVVVSMDGGRVRLREKKRGPKTKKGRTRYDGSWREPKLLIIYVVDDQGKLEKSFTPLIDGCIRIKNPDALFLMLEGYLKSLGIQNAARVLFVADGARWIWKRVPGLVEQLGLDPDRVHQLIDFYHAVEHLGKVAELRKKWSAKERKTWVSKQRGRLLKGEAAAVIKAVQDICRGRKSKAIAKERNYFVKNAHRLNYPMIKELGLLIGSGAIESAIRRVINLRLKGSCIFWYRENAEKILMLRAYYKSGRWNYLKQMANSHASLLAA